MANAVDMDHLLLEMRRAFNVSAASAASPASPVSTASTSLGMSTASTGSTAYTPSPASTTSTTSTSNLPPPSLSTQRSLPPFHPIPLSQTHTTGQPIPSPPLPDIIPPSIPLPPHLCPSSAKPCSLPSVLLSPDLIPLILIPLLPNTKMFLSLRLVCRTWDEVIRSAPGLRTAFFALPMWKRPADDFLLLDLGLGAVGRGLSIRRGKEVEKGCWIEVRMGKAAAVKVLGSTAGRRSSTAGRTRRVGDVEPKEEWTGRAVEQGLRLEDLFVTQPPILGMQAFVEEVSPSELTNDGGESKEAVVSTVSNDEDDLRESPAPVAKLSCDAGITLGFLAETTLSLLSGGDVHRRVRSRGESSKSAIEPEQDDERRVVFKAIVSFCAPRVEVRKRGVVRTVTSFG
ncbi:unnamed protein product [Zymoseptoria tritici ST99CH_3D1]|nr:unnamed protein product [Zymoseptoria tritici ST99CH_3D1]